MGEVVWGINGTLDGRCGHEDGVPDEAVHQDAAEAFAGYDALVMGRVTHDLMFPFWADVARERSAAPTMVAFADAILAIPKVVFSRTLADAGWGTRVVSTSPVDEVRRMRAEGARIHLGASPALAAQLRRAGVVDRVRLVLHPVVAGRGPLLFEPDEAGATTLLSVERLGAAHVVLEYALH